MRLTFYTESERLLRRMIPYRAKGAGGGSSTKRGSGGKKTSEATLAMYIPQIAANALRMECISWVHAHPFTGHVGMHRTSEILRRDFWWPTMEQDIIQYVQNCEMYSRKQAYQQEAGRPTITAAYSWKALGKYRDGLYYTLA